MFINDDGPAGGPPPPLRYCGGGSDGPMGVGCTVDVDGGPEGYDCTGLGASTKYSDGVKASGLLCCETDSALWFDRGTEGVFFRMGRIQGGRELCGGLSWRGDDSRGICVTACDNILDQIKEKGSKINLRLQNSSMRSPDRKPHTYLPLNLRRRPTHERRASRADGIRFCRASDLQFRRIATKVRPAWVNW